MIIPHGGFISRDLSLAFILRDLKLMALVTELQDFN